jgi:hypothetical protein
MQNTFSEVKLFQVRPDLLDEFEKLVGEMIPAQQKQPGSLGIRYMKRFYVLDEVGRAPRALTKIVKCVKYYAYWEFTDIEAYGKANGWFFEQYAKRLQRLLIMPFDIHSGYSLYGAENGAVPEENRS